MIFALLLRTHQDIQELEVKYDSTEEGMPERDSIARKLEECVSDANQLLLALKDAEEHIGELRIQRSLQIY
ncbi:MAG: hypothetical protein R2874_12350 [Desulfobacterales bacterium]